MINTWKTHMKSKCDRDEYVANEKYDKSST